MIVYTIAIGPADTTVLDIIEPFLAERFRARVSRLAPLPEPPNAFDPRRRQYDSVHFLRTLVAACPNDADRLLGITSRDLCIPMLTFVFGQAQLRGRVALVSTARLDTQFYGMPAERNALLARSRKEVLHEMGHTFGLIHCPDATCAMSLSTAIQHVDAKSDKYCGTCNALLLQSLRAGIGDQR
jgi:archaemetzincin